VVSGGWGAHAPRAHHDCPYGSVGDRLWVRETWAAPHDLDAAKPTEMPDGTRIHYRATWEGPSGLAWRPSIFLQRRFARLVLEVTRVRVEQAHAITASDVRAEGVAEEAIAKWGQFVHPDDAPGSAFAELWDSINAKRAAWASNPWLWVIEFRRLEPKAVAA
jgi:hypothetical protein